MKKLHIKLLLAILVGMINAGVIYFFFSLGNCSFNVCDWSNNFQNAIAIEPPIFTSILCIAILLHHFENV